MKIALSFGFAAKLIALCSIICSLMASYGCGTEVGNGFAPNDPDDPPIQQDVSSPNPDTEPLPANEAKTNDEANHNWSANDALNWENLQAAPSFLLTSCKGPLHKLISDAGDVTHFELGSGTSLHKINIIKTSSEKWEIYSNATLKYSFELEAGELLEAFDENSNQVSLLNCAEEIETLATDAEFIEQRPYSAAELGSGLSFNISTRTFYMYWVYTSDKNSISDIKIYDSSSQSNAEIRVTAK